MELIWPLKEAPGPKLGDKKNQNAESSFTIEPCDQSINKRSEFVLRTGTKDFRTGFYEGTDRAKAVTLDLIL